MASNADQLEREVRALRRRVTQMEERIDKLVRLLRATMGTGETSENDGNEPGLSARDI